MPYILNYSRSKSIGLDLLQEISDAAICAYEHDDHYHSAVVTDDGTIWESAPGVGIRRRQATLADYAAADKYGIEGATLEQWDGIFAWFKAHEGEPYAFEKDVDFISGGDCTDIPGWDCSESVFTAALSVGIELMKRVEPCRVDPRDINISPLLIGPL